jgi:hypothetical protein
MQPLIGQLERPLVEFVAFPSTLSTTSVTIRNLQSKKTFDSASPICLRLQLQLQRLQLLKLRNLEAA